MLVILSDTHRRDDPGLTDAVETAIKRADLVAHAGDFTSEAVLGAFEQRASQFVAVSGNRDTQAVRKQVAEQHVFEYADTRILLVHGHRYTQTNLSLRARQEDVNVVITGHTHRPTIRMLGEQLLVNPGSHADPRGNQAAFGVIESTDDGLAVKLRTVDGTVFKTTHYESPERE